MAADHFDHGDINLIAMAKSFSSWEKLSFSPRQYYLHHGNIIFIMWLEWCHVSSQDAVGAYPTWQWVNNFGNKVKIWVNGAVKNVLCKLWVCHVSLHRAPTAPWELTWHCSSSVIEKWYKHGENDSAMIKLILPWSKWFCSLLFKDPGCWSGWTLELTTSRVTARCTTKWQNDCFSYELYLSSDDHTEIASVSISNKLHESHIFITSSSLLFS